MPISLNENGRPFGTLTHCPGPGAAFKAHPISAIWAYLPFYTTLPDL